MALFTPRDRIEAVERIQPDRYIGFRGKILRTFERSKKPLIIRAGPLSPSGAGIHLSITDGERALPWSSPRVIPLLRGRFATVGFCAP